jgi:two-component system, OmpR family, alkaline phosphatase synthesis response regulator PhoP
MSAVLIVEDEQHLADGLRFNLEAEGYRVDVAGDGETALAWLTGGGRHYDAVILDVMLPGQDGFAVVSELRQAGQFVPVLMLTARGRAEDVLRGFESGADDYLPKPFELAILLARLGGLLRRREWLARGQSGAGRTVEAAGAAGATEAQAIKADERVGRAAVKAFSFGGKLIDFGALELHTAGRVVRLTLMEADLLHFLISRAGQAVARKTMLEEVWGLHEDTDTRVIDNFIVRLRRYIEDEPSKPRHLLTVRGVGYRFIPEPSKVQNRER